MNYQAHLVSPAEKDAFNSFIAGHSKGHVLQSYQWGEVKRPTGWEPLRLLVTKGKLPVAAVSILKRPIPVFGWSLFYAPRGPVVDFNDRPLFEFLLGEVRSLARKHHAFLLKIDPDIPQPAPEIIASLEKNGFRIAKAASGFEGTQPRFVFRLDISPEPESLLQVMNPKTRYNIRLAERRGVTVSTGGRENLPEFYEVLKETAKRDGFLVRSRGYFETMWDCLAPDGLAQLFLAYHQGELLAGTLVLTMGNKAWYLYGASSSTNRQLMPNYLLQWNMINWSRERGCRLYDFRGVSGEVSEDNPLYGLYRFKKGFGATFTEFIGEYDLVYKSLSYALWRAAEPLYYRGIRRLLRGRRES